MTWSPNNLSCTTTWSTLFALDESVRPFPDSGGAKMRQFAFWNTAAGDDLRTLKATALALQVDKIFRLVRGAAYEPGVSHEQAIEEMRDTFLSGDDTMEDLADVNDRNYRFWQEGA